MAHLSGVNKIMGANCTLLWPDIFTMAINAESTEEKHRVHMVVRPQGTHRDLRVKVVSKVRDGGVLKVLCQEWAGDKLLPVFMVFGRKGADPWELRGAYSVDLSDYVHHHAAVLHAYLLSA